MHSQGLTDWLANLTIVQVSLGIVVMGVLRLCAVRLVSRAEAQPNPIVARTGRSIIELADSLLYACAIAFLLVKPIIAQPFYIPSGSMEPTIHGDNEDEDRVWVYKLGYRFSPPKRGDVVVFLPPESAGDARSNNGELEPWIKRLVALGGDTLQVTAGRVYINGQPYSHEDVRRMLAAVHHFGDDDPMIDDASDREFRAVHHIKFTETAVLVDGKAISNSYLAQLGTGDAKAPVDIVPGKVIRNGVVLDEPYTAEDADYDMKIVDGSPLKENFARGDAAHYEYNGSAIGPEQYQELNAKPAGALPANTLFMMGDNRNDSDDSTEWGPLPANRVIGKAEAIFWPPNRATMRL